MLNIREGQSTGKLGHGSKGRPTAAHPGSIEAAVNYSGVSKSKAQILSELKAELKDKDRTLPISALIKEKLIRKGGFEREKGKYFNYELPPSASSLFGALQPPNYPLKKTIAPKDEFLPPPSINKPIDQRNI